MQQREVVRFVIADRRVEAAFALARAEHVPDADAVRQHACEPRLVGQLGERLDSLEPGLAARIARSLVRLHAGWPGTLPRGIIHADLFPDNVLFLGTRVSGLIDFYFAATDLLAYDVAVLRAAWSFSSDGRRHLPANDAALLGGYQSIRPLSKDELAALPLLGEAACLRFLLTRALDWFEQPADALVTRKDPLAFARRLTHYAPA